MLSCCGVTDGIVAPQPAGNCGVGDSDDEEWQHVKQYEGQEVNILPVDIWWFWEVWDTQASLLLLTDEENYSTEGVWQENTLVNNRSQVSTGLQLIINFSGNLTVLSCYHVKNVKIVIACPSNKSWMLWTITYDLVLHTVFVNGWEGVILSAMSTFTHFPAFRNSELYLIRVSGFVANSVLECRLLNTTMALYIKTMMKVLHIKWASVSLNIITVFTTKWVDSILPVWKSQEFLVDCMWEGEAAGHYPDNCNPNTTLSWGHSWSQRM